MDKITIKDIATKANVSIATVSRVINGNYYVTPELKFRVEEAISELNYIPNAVAQNLKNNSTHLIGYVVSDIENNYFTSLAYHVEEVINREGYNIIIFSSNRDKDRELAYLKLLLSNNVDGIIINSSGFNDSFVAEISKSMPIVSLSRKIHDSSFSGDFIDSDNLYGVYKLTRHLIDFGHRNIAVINGDLKLSTGIERYTGFINAMKDAGIPVHKEYVYSGDFTMQSGYKASEYLLALATPPSVIIAMNNSMALGAIHYLTDQNIKVPEQVSLACYGNINSLELFKIQPSYVSLNPQIIGIKSGELILSRIKNRQQPKREIIYEPILVECSGVGRI